VANGSAVVKEESAVLSNSIINVIMHHYFGLIITIIMYVQFHVPEPELGL
jgi:hypothetical protein